MDKRRFVTDDESTCSASEGYLTEDEVEKMKKRYSLDFVIAAFLMIYVT